MEFSSFHRYLQTFTAPAIGAVYLPKIDLETYPKEIKDDFCLKI